MASLKDYGSKIKSDYYELKKKDDAYTLEYVGGL